MSKKIRRVGDITGDLEPLLLELVGDHDLQHHEVLGIIKAYLDCHCPYAIETYDEDGSHPVFYYGHREGIK